MLIEIKRMNEIKVLLKNKFPENSKKLRNTIFIDLEQINLKSQKTESYNRLLKQSFMGSQYKWMASLSDEIKGLELCVHIDDKVYYFLKNNIERRECDLSSGYTIKQDAEQDIINVFGNLNFPILDYSKNDMMNYAKKYDFFEIMERTWFCFNPINDEPCGLCNPCKYSLEEGMKFRFSKKALFRNKYSRLFNKYRAIINRIEKAI